jgi:hypothetical protein
VVAGAREDVTMLTTWIRVKLLVPTAGGLSSRPFVRDTTDRARFPPRIRLEATLLGASLGVLEMTSGEGVGRIRHLRVGRLLPGEVVAGRLLSETERVAPLASWKRLEWDVPADQGQPASRAWAERQGFAPADDGALHKPLTR